MNLTNNLPRIANAFIIAQEALRAAKLIIRANREVYRKPIAKMPELAAKLGGARQKSAQTPFCYRDAKLCL